MKLPKVSAETRVAAVILALALGCAGCMTAGIYALLGAAWALLFGGAFLGVGAYLIARGAR